MRIIRLDGSPATAGDARRRLADALDGGPAVLPVAAGPDPAPRRRAGRRRGVLVATSGSTGLAAAGRAPGRRAAGLRGRHRRAPRRARTLAARPSRRPRRRRPGRSSGRCSPARPPVVQDLRGGFRPATASPPPRPRSAPAGAARASYPPSSCACSTPGGAALEALRGYAAVLVGGAALDAGLRARAEAAGRADRHDLRHDRDGRAAASTTGVPLGRGARALERRRPGRARRPDPGGRLPRPTRRDRGRVRRATATAPSSAPATWAAGWTAGWRCVGRADDVIVTGGEKVAPAAVERVLPRSPGCGRRASSACPTPSGARSSRPPWSSTPRRPTGTACGRRCAQSLGRAAVPRVLRTVDALPLRGHRQARPGRGRPSARRATRASLHGVTPRHPDRWRSLSGLAPPPTGALLYSTVLARLPARRGDVRPGTDRRHRERATMRMARGATAALPSLAAATGRRATAGRVRVTAARGARPAPGVVRWSPPLAGEAVGVTVSGRTVRLAGGPRAARPHPRPTATAPAAPPGC